MASSRSDQLGTRQRSDQPITGTPPLGRSRAAHYYRRLRESRYLTSYPKAIGARLAELGQAPGKLWLRVRSAYEVRRPISAGTRSGKKVDQPPSNFLIVLEAPKKVASSIRSLSEGATKLGTAAIPGVAAGDELTASLRQAYSAPDDSGTLSSRFLLPGTSFRGIPGWLLIGAATLLLIAIPLVVLQVVSPRFRGLGDLSAQVSGDLSSEGGEGQTSGSGGAGILGTDFAGAYVLEVRHLSSTRTMFRIRVPLGVEGGYQALVKMSQESEFQCVVLKDRADELFCIGPRLSIGRAEISVFHLNAPGESPTLVFEVSYFIAEDTVRPGPAFPVPVPTVAPYGAGFSWPDRFNEAEVDREAASNSVLAPASALATILVMGVWLLPRAKSDSDRRRTR